MEVFSCIVFIFVDIVACILVYLNFVCLMVNTSPFNAPVLTSMFQLTAAMYEIHEIFFELPIRERMAIISMSRRIKRERLFRPEVEVAKHISIPGCCSKIQHLFGKKTTFVSLIHTSFSCKTYVLDFDPYTCYFLKGN